jgi:hypothetical protein
MKSKRPCSLYPNATEKHTEKSFEADNADDYYANDYEDGLDEDDLDMFEGDDSFEDFGFEEIGINL